ncbi:MAG: phage/plasmid primase, P4 family, partial [Methanocorpusculum sp.]|nr:phage/plasmid primase, P4 family [Methanocorpusculum sp.]
GAKFTRLYSGDTSDYGGDDSRADQALCSMLAFWTGNNAAQMDSIFRTSGLYRVKWDKKHGAQTYGEMTISRAIRGNHETYKPPEKTQTRKNKAEVKTTATITTGKFSFTDLGNSERLIKKFGIDLRYCHEFKKWFIWNGKQWQEDNQGRIFFLATQTIRAMIDEAKDLPDDERLSLIRWSLKSESRDKIKAMVDLAQNHPEAVVSYGQFDRNPWLLNLQNGTLNLKDGKLQPHNREDYISKISPIEYNSAATSPTWDRFINEIMDNKMDLIKYLQKLAGHSLTGDVSEQDLYICHGTGGNGKSVFLNTIMAMLGPDYTKQTSATALLVKQNETCGEEIAVLAGARFVATLETEDGKRLAESLVKQLVGGDKIRARFLYGNSFEFQPCLKLWMATNHKPKVTGMDTGIWRRIKLLPFTVSIPEEKQDRQLPEKLKAELSGILNWCIDGCLQWQREGLKPPAEVETATSEYKNEMDTIGTFLINNCQTGPDFKSTSKGLYEVYVKWCEDGGERPLSQRKFGSRLRERGFISHVGTGNRTYWKGLGIKAGDYQDMNTGEEWQGMGKRVSYRVTERNQFS